MSQNIEESFDAIHYLLPSEIEEEIIELKKNIKIFRERLSVWKRNPEGVTRNVSNSYTLLIADQIDLIERMLREAPYRKYLQNYATKMVTKYKKQFVSLSERLTKEVTIIETEG